MLCAPLPLLLLAAAAVVVVVNGEIVPRVQLTAEYGPEVSAISWGHLSLEKLSVDDVVSRLHQCISLGITLIDTADIYPPTGDQGSNIVLLGAAFAADPSLRPQLEIVAKVGLVSIVPFVVNTTRAYIDGQIAHYLETLGTDYLDIVLIHQPDPNLDIAALSALFEERVIGGSVGFFGVSNWENAVFDEFQAHYSFPLVTNQIEFSVYTPEEGNDGRAMTHLAAINRRPLLWGPLGGNPVGGTNRLFVPPHSPRVRRILAALETVAAEIGNNTTVDQVALAWTMFHPSGSIPIIGTMNSTRMTEQVVGAIGVLPAMTQEMYDEILAAAQ